MQRAVNTTIVEEVFSMWFAYIHCWATDSFRGSDQELYKDALTTRPRLRRVEAGSNTSTVALRVVGSDEKGTQCLGVKLGHPLPGGYKYGDLALGSLESETVKYSHESHGTRTRE
jgi:hypothetical protein